MKNNFKYFLFTIIIATLTSGTTAEAKKRRKKYGPVPFVEKGIGGIELGDQDSSLKIIGQKRLEEIWSQKEDLIKENGIGLNGLHEGEIVILKPHKKDPKFAFSEVIIGLKTDFGDQKPVMADPITVAALTDHEVRIDTPKEQIHKTFGKPSQIKKDSGGEVWIYRIKQNQDKTKTLASNERQGYFHEFSFQDSKVKKIRYGFED